MESNRPYPDYYWVCKHVESKGQVMFTRDPLTEICTRKIEDRTTSRIGQMIREEKEMLEEERCSDVFGCEGSEEHSLANGAYQESCA